MSENLDKQHRIERHKTVRAGLWLVALLVVAAILFGVYRFVTAPVRAAKSGADSAVEAVDEVATRALTVRHVEVSRGRRFGRLAEAAHGVLVDYPESEPRDMADRAFRAANLRGAENRVCTFEMDFGDGPVTVHAAADNAAFATNRAMGGQDERQVRLVFTAGELSLGLNAEYDASLDEPGWQLLWRRRNAARKPLTDATAAQRAADALAAIPERCTSPRVE